MECVACGENLAGVESVACRGADGSRYDYLVCPACGLMILVGGTDFAANARRHDAGYYGKGESKFPGLINGIMELLAGRRAGFVEGLREGCGRVLDIGCGDGMFLKRMAARGCEVHGTELPGPAFDRASRIPAIHMHPADTSEWDFVADYFDLITAWHVLEHVADPEPLLKKCHGILRSDGLLVVDVPDRGSLQGRMFGTRWFHLDPPRHVYQFTGKAIRHLLENSGFRVKAVSHPVDVMGPFGALQSLLNVVVPRRDLFYDLLRSRGRCGASFRWALVSLALALPALVVGTLIAGLEYALGRGAVLRVVARRA